MIKVNLGVNALEIEKVFYEEFVCGSDIVGLLFCKLNTISDCNINIISEIFNNYCIDLPSENSFILNLILDELTHEVRYCIYFDETNEYFPYIDELSMDVKLSDKEFINIYNILKTKLDSDLTENKLD